MGEPIINGDVYIKMLPDIVTRHVINKERSEDIEANLQIAGEEVDIDELQNETIEELSSIVKEMLLHYGVIKQESAFVYNNNGFYQIWCMDNMIYMINKEDKISQTYPSMNSLKMKYINLWEYLNRAKFVGLYIMNPGHTMYEYLYTLNGINLLRDPSIGEYMIMANGNPALEGYFPKNIKTNQYNINTVYQNIINQVMKNCHSEENKRR